MASVLWLYIAQENNSQIESNHVAQSNSEDDFLNIIANVTTENNHQVTTMDSITIVTTTIPEDITTNTEVQETTTSISVNDFPSESDTSSSQIDTPIEDTLSPKFSIDGGFYDKSVTLELSSTSGKTIYYTIDGSKPDINSIVYTKPIVINLREGEPNYIANRDDTSVTPYVVETPVDKATVIKAIAVDDNGNVSNVISHTYFVGLDISKDYNNTKVVSISTDEENLFDYDTGIYVKGATYDNWIYNGGSIYDTKDYFQPANYKKTGSDWEREVSIEIFDVDGTSMLSQNVGMRIMGGSSRTSVQKSLKFYARSNYGDSKIHCKLIPNLHKEIDNTKNIKKFDTFVLRNGGTDYYGMKFRDAFIQTLISDRDVSRQSSTPVVAFLNGEYLGVYNLQEDYSDYYIQSHYDVPKEDVVMIKCNEIEEGTDEDYQLYQELLNFVNNQDLSQDEVYQEFCNMVDIQSLIDYFAFECYIDNEDWIDMDNNFRLWRSRTVTDKPYQDGKWRWAVYDTEYSMGVFDSGYYTENTLNNLIDAKNKDGVNIFVKPLLKNEDFKRQFVNSFLDIMNVNFEKNHACDVLDTFVADYSPLLNDSFIRTGPDWRTGTIEEMEDYFNRLVEKSKYFLNNRFDYCFDMLSNTLDLSGEKVRVALRTSDIKNGTIQINSSVPEFHSNYWTGTYLSDYPVTLTAKPVDGHKFIKWVGDCISPEDANKETISIPLNQDVNVMAVFS